MAPATEIDFQQYLFLDLKSLVIGKFQSALSIKLEEAQHIQF